MDNAVSLVKGWYSSGQSYISSYSDNHKNKAAFVKIQKSATIYDARCFHSSQLDTNKCIRTLTNLIYLFNQGQHFTEDEGTQIFFAITKLLQSQDTSLRRVVYVSVKEMKKQPSIYVVTSSLLKDIHHKNSNFRRNSLRTIPLIADASNLSQIQRYIKALIVDPDVGVSSAALLSGLQMFRSNEELVKKWGTQINQKLSSKDPYVQCHALMLLGDTKRKDFNSYKKILFSLMKQETSGLATVQFLRMLRDIAKTLEHDSPQASEFIKYICKQARSKDDMVQIQACKLACESSLMSNKQLLDIVKMLEVFLVSESTVKKYSVLKIFNSLLKNEYRKSLIINVKQIEKVLNGKNTSLSSIAASILLRICSENYLETLFIRIEKTMSQMSTEYKRDVIRSLENVLKTYPKQYKIINQFLVSIMKKEDSIAIKSDAIEIMNYQIKNNREAKSDCIKQLSKLLSATNYSRIHFQILGIISRQAGKEDINSQIFKNVISEIYLQEGAVRACGLSTLIRISQHQQKQKVALQKTIQEFKNDSSLEVRERLVFKQKQKPLSSYQLDILEHYLSINADQIKISKDRKMLSFDTIKKWGAEVGSTMIEEKKKTNTREVETEKMETQEYQTYKEIFQNHPTFQSYGVLRKINKSIHLSDNENDLYVTMRLFLFDSSFIAQFKIQNNLINTVIQNVRVDLKHEGQDFDIAHIIPAKVIKSKGTSQVFVGLKKSEECQSLLAEEKFKAIVKFTVKEMKGEDVKATYQDQFSLQNFQIKLASYLAPWNFDPSQFPKMWEQMKGEQKVSTYQLKYSSTQAAEHELLRHFGLRKFENPEASQGNMVVVNLAGNFLGSNNVLMMLSLAFDTKLGCLLKIRVKTQDEELTEELIGSIE